MVFEILKLTDNFPDICNNVAIAQLIESLAWEQEYLSLIPRKGEIFFT